MPCARAHSVRFTTPAYYLEHAFAIYDASTEATVPTLARKAPYVRSGTDGPGVSVFLREDGRVFHTYSAYARGLDPLLGTYHWLDLTPLGRQRHVVEFPHHDTYAKDS
jgi:predicted dithiol-disulfide oxidoreductase (DUF899 family)